MFFNSRSGGIFVEINRESLAETKGPKRGSLTMTQIPRSKKYMYEFKNWKWNWGELLPQQEGLPQNELTMIVVSPRLN